MNTASYSDGVLNNTRETLELNLAHKQLDIPCNPIQYESQLIDSLIRDQTKATIYTTNGYQEHGLIRAHDDDVVVIVGYAGDFPKIMYKHAISTIEQDRNQSLQIGPNSFINIPMPDLTKTTLKAAGLEKFWLDKFIRNHSKVTIVTSSGYQEHGIIVGHDNLVISFIRYESDSSRITYKSSISTIIMKSNQ